ncbi:MAG: hypothetical protein R2848_09780 [Thermomicrobiales bacterium]
MTDAAGVQGIMGIEITAPMNQPIVALPESSSYLGFIFARGDSAEDAERALREVRIPAKLRDNSNYPASSGRWIARGARATCVEALRHPLLALRLAESIPQAFWHPHREEEVVHLLSQQLTGLGISRVETIVVDQDGHMRLPECKSFGGYLLVDSLTKRTRKGGASSQAVLHPTSRN